MIELITKLPSEIGDSNGLFQYMKEYPEILQNLKFSSSQIHNGNKTSFLHWGAYSQFHANRDEPAFFAFSFYEMGIQLTNYTFYIHDDYCYSSTYSLIGVNTEKTVLLDKRNLSQYCDPDNHPYPDTIDLYCGKNLTKTFPVSYSNETFSYLIFTTENGSCPEYGNGNHISFNGIELFGTLYKIPQYCTCSDKNTFQYISFFYLICIFI